MYLGSLIIGLSTTLVIDSLYSFTKLYYIRLILALLYIVLRNYITSPIESTVSKLNRDIESLSFYILP